MSAFKPAQPVSPQVKDSLPTSWVLGTVVGWPPSLFPPAGGGGQGEISHRNFGRGGDSKSAYPQKLPGDQDNYSLVTIPSAMKVPAFTL